MNKADALPDWITQWAETFDARSRRRITRGLATGLRRRQAQRIARQQNPDGTPFAPRKPRRRDQAGGIRRRAAMFRGLRQVRHLRALSDERGVSVGFAGAAARIAAVSQFGQVDHVERGGPLARYPIRELLGFSAADREWVLAELRRATDLDR